MIARMIFVKVAPHQIAQAIEEWKNTCAPLMISQPGCLSEELLECNENPNEFISLSNWESMEAIQAYRVSEAHEKIKHGTRGIEAEVVVKTYKVTG
jgi:heme-degrading monooxygenase HmoA